MRAFTAQTKVDVNQSFYPTQYDIDSMFPRHLPHLALQFSRAIPSQFDDVLKTVGYTQVKYKGKDIIIIERPSVALLRHVATMGAISTCPAPANSANLEALGTLTLVQRIFSNFLRTHHYPAFRTPEHMNQVARLEIEEGVASGKRKALPSSQAAARKKTRSGVVTATPDPDENMEDTDADTHAPSQDVFYALPPDPDSVGWGSIDQIPHCHGIFVPFVLDLADPDKKMVPSVIRRYFLGCLGHNTETIRVVMRAIDSAWGILSYTDVGHELAHLAKCIDLSLVAQAQCFPLFEDERYNGCVILGAGFTIISGEESFVPVDYDTLHGRVEAFGTHRTALTAIALHAGVDINILLRLDDGTPIDSMYKLALVLQGMRMTEATKDDILKLAIHLHFGKSWQFNFTALEGALGLLVDDKPLPSDLPIHCSVLFSSNRVELVWSCFGPMAPSPHYPSTPSFDLTKVARPNHINFHHVRLSQAIADIKTVISSRRITVPTNRKRSGPYKDTRYETNEAKAIMAHLTKLVGTVDVIEGTGAGIGVEIPENMFALF
jgi:hypothetical protein